MSVYINKDGKKEGPKKPRSYWTGAANVNGVRMTFKLNPWRGVPPGPDEKHGDLDFEASRIDALKKLKEKVDQIKTGKPTSDYALNEKSDPNAACIGFEEIFRRFIEYKTPRCCEARLAIIKERASSFFNYLHKNGVKNLETSTIAQVKEWLEIRRGAPATTEEMRGMLKLIYKRYCKSAAKIVEDVCEMEKDIQTFESRKIFSPEEITNILEKAAKISPLVKMLITIAACTGLRFKDIALMKWESINLERGLITLITHKTKGNAIIGIWPLLRTELEALPKTGEYLFPEAVENYRYFFKSALNDLRRVLVAAGYSVEDMSIKKDGYLKRVGIYGWHSFRGSFVVAALRAGASIDILKKILGSKTVEIIYDHYIKIDDSFLQESFTSKPPSFAQGK